MTTPSVTDVRFHPAHHGDQAAGLLGWTSFVLDESLLVTSVAVRRTRDGVLTLSFPERTDRAGHRHAILRPLGDERRKQIEQCVFDALRTNAAGMGPAE